MIGKTNMSLLLGNVSEGRFTIIPAIVIVALLGVVTLGAVLITLWDPTWPEPMAPRSSHILLGAVGLLVGFFGGALGLGGGFILVPAFRMHGMTLRDAISNALVAGGFITLVGLITKLPEHSIPLWIILVVGLTSVMGTAIGNYIGQRIPTLWLQYLVLGGMCVASLKIWLGIL